VTCEKCQKREQDEKKALSDCESQKKELQTKMTRLTVAAAVGGTLVGREVLQEAADLMGSLTDLVGLKVIDNDWSVASNVGTPDLTVEDSSGGINVDPMPVHEQGDNPGFGVAGYSLTASTLPGAEISMIESLENYDVIFGNSVLTAQVQTPSVGGMEDTVAEVPVFSDHKDFIKSEQEIMSGGTVPVGPVSLLVLSLFWLVPAVFEYRSRMRFYRRWIEKE
jgi:hypothetical protein